ncbi:MAG: hypothetical protein U9R10_05255 [Euryarchaeota archaeon]|nr:hypothetical protein [Euryarchaeota archaeon]
MNTSKIMLMGIAVVAMGIFALPSTVSLFAGQHSWYDLSESVGGTSGVNNVPCEKCHQDIGDEMKSGGNGVHRDLTCAMCHRAPFTGYTYARGHYEHGTLGTQPPRPGQEAHAASAIACMDCHAAYDPPLMNSPHTKDREYSGKCGNCHLNGNYGAGCLAAGGFGLTPYESDTGTNATHKQFVLGASGDTLMEGANEACIACHTRIGVNITWTKSAHMNFTASKDETGMWSIPDFTAEGTNITYVNSSNEWTNP